MHWKQRQLSNFVLNPSPHWKPVECSQQCCCTCMPGLTKDKGVWKACDVTLPPATSKLLPKPPLSSQPPLLMTAALKDLTLKGCRPQGRKSHPSYCMKGLLFRRTLDGDACRPHEGGCPPQLLQVAIELVPQCRRFRPHVLPQSII